MDDTQLVLTVIGAVAAIAAAVFAYPAWSASRAKPDLRLIVEAGPATSALFLLRLQNSGRGAATDWMVVMKMARGSRFMPADRTFDSWRDREVAEGWIATWMARGSDDTIGPGLHRDVLLGPAGGSNPLRADYSIKANGMNERTGRITVKIGDRPDRRQAIRVT